MRIEKTFVRFILVGILNTIFGYLVYAISLFIGFNYFFATLFSAVLGVLFNFKTIGKLVFDNSNNNLIFKFIACYCVIFVFNIFLLWIAATSNMNLYYAGMVVTAIGALLSYIINKNWVFKKVDL